MLVYGHADRKYFQKGPGMPGVIVATTESAGGVAHVVYADYQSPLYIVPQQFFVPDRATLRGLTASQKRKRETSPFSVGSPVEFESFQGTHFVEWITIGHTESKMLHYEDGVPHLHILAVSSGQALWTKEFLYITNELREEKMKDEFARAPCNTPLIVSVALELDRIPAVPELLTFNPGYSFKVTSLRVAPIDASRSIVEQAPWNDPRTMIDAAIAAGESRPNGSEQQDHMSMGASFFAVTDHNTVYPQGAADAAEKRGSGSEEADSNSNELQSLVQRILINNDDHSMEQQDHMSMGASFFAVTDHNPVYPQGAADAAEKRGSGSEEINSNSKEESGEPIVIDDDDDDDDCIELLDNASVGAYSGLVLVSDDDDNDDDDGIEVLNDGCANDAVPVPLFNLAPALQALNTMADGISAQLPKKEEDMAEESAKRKEMQNMQVWYSMGDDDGGDAAPV